MEGLGINFKLLLAQILNFVIFFFIFKRYIAKPFLNFIKQGKEKEAEKERILSELKAKEEKMAEEETKHQKKMKSEMQAALKRVTQEAAKLREELIQKTKDEVADMKAKAQAQTEDERAKMLREIRGRIVDLSVTIVNSALKDYLTDNAKKEVTDNILKNSSVKELEV